MKTKQEFEQQLTELSGKILQLNFQRIGVEKELKKLSDEFIEVQQKYFTNYPPKGLKEDLESCGN